MISFNELGKYIENILNETTYSLYTKMTTEIMPDGSEIETEKREISNLYRYRVYYDSGDIIHPSEELPENTIGVNILNTGLIQDSSTPLTSYLQSIQVQFLGKENYRQDLYTILNEISIEYKSKMDTINNKPVETSIDEFPEFSDREFNGEYWHYQTEPNSHDEIKVEQCKQLGIQLKIVREKDWDNQQNKVKQELKEFLYEIA